MTTKKLTKLLALYLPYILLGLVATNFGEAWRLAEGKELGDKIMSMMGTVPLAFANPLPSLHPLDILVGLCCGAGLRLAVYLRGKNAKKYRHGMEYGSARWGSAKDIEPFMAPKFSDNIILTKTERLMMSNRPPDPKNARNKNVLVVGGSGSGKTRFWLKPNLLQCHSSYVVTDPKGTIVLECGQAMLKNGYKVKVLNTINFKKSIADWIKGILTAGIMSNLSGLFDDVNTQVGNIAQQVGTKPSSFEPRVFAMIEALSRNVVLPIAGIILTFIACYELIEMITQHNNMAQFEPALIMRWIFKTAVSVWLISNTFDIVMAVFDVTQKVVSDSSSIVAGNTRVNDIGLSMLQSSLMQMDVGPLFGLFLQSFFIGITMRILSIVIFVIVYGRMIEIYCMVSLAPIPMATFGNHEQSHMGQNYLKCLFALGFQGFLILICVAIYAVLIQSVAISGDAINSIWSIVGYTVLLCFSLFKTSSVTKSVLGAH